MNLIYSYTLRAPSAHRLRTPRLVPLRGLARPADATAPRTPQESSARDARDTYHPDT